MPKGLSSPVCFEMFICSSTHKCTQIVSHSKELDSLSDTANSDFDGKKQYNSYTAHGRIRILFHYCTFCDYVSLSYSKNALHVVFHYNTNKILSNPSQKHVNGIPYFCRLISFGIIVVLTCIYLTGNVKL